MRCPVEKRPDKFPNEELDEAVIAADDTGMLAEQHVVIEEEILEATQPEDNPPEEG
jgi:hypothetical protein